RLLRVGGAPVPDSLRDGFEDRHGIAVRSGFGMTELTATGGISSMPSALANGSPNERRRARRKSGRPLPFLEVRARADGAVGRRDAGRARAPRALRHRGLLEG
ncbi:MAG: hypothetical protein ACREX8_10095, partial [Gammaproteobacteria bacterium]